MSRLQLSQVYRPEFRSMFSRRESGCSGGEEDRWRSCKLLRLRFRPNKCLCFGRYDSIGGDRSSDGIPLAFIALALALSSPSRFFSSFLLPSPSLSLLFHLLQLILLYLWFSTDFESDGREIAAALCRSPAWKRYGRLANPEVSLAGSSSSTLFISLSSWALKHFLQSELVRSSVFFQPPSPQQSRGSR